MRKINYLVVHCAATQNLETINAETIRGWHVKQNKWRDIGYHFVITTSGKLEMGRPIEEVGAHVSGFNANSIGVCLVGGVDKAGKSVDNFTNEQKRTLYFLLQSLKARFTDAKIQGHRDFQNVKKDCPCFNVGDWLKKTDEKMIDIF